MRLLVYARSQVAVPLYMVLKLDRPTVPVCLLMGGMPEDMIEREIAKFKADPAAIMVATAAHATGWRADVEAMVLFTEDSFIFSHAQASACVREPGFDPPEPKDLLAMIQREPEYVVVSDPAALPAPCPQPRQEGDEYVCSKCSLRWDTHEDRPPCPNR